MKYVVTGLTIICLIFFIGCGQDDKTEKPSSTPEEKLGQTVEAVIEPTGSAVEIMEEKTGQTVDTMEEETEDAIAIETVKGRTNQTAEAVNEKTGQIDLSVVDLPNPQTIKEVQSILDHLGYEPGPIDGILGSRTEKAVKTFLNDQGILQNHKIDNNLILLLRKAKNQ